MRSARVSCGTASDLGHESVGTQSRREFIVKSSPGVLLDVDEVPVEPRDVSLFEAASRSVAPVVDGDYRVIASKKWHC